MFEQPISPTTNIVRLNLMQGEVRVSAGPRVEISTVLGSCVASCMFDPEIEVGGMNHFLLAEPPSGRKGVEVDEHYGVYLMELLINEMLAHGARKHRLRAHLYGGANLHPGMAQIGTSNGEFARRFLERERIQVVREDIGGSVARRVDFRPASGMVRCRKVEASQAPVPQPKPLRAVSGGDVELF